jgi:hypothetical protein
MESKKIFFIVYFSDILPNFTKSGFIREFIIFKKKIIFLLSYKIVPNKSKLGRCVKCDNRDLYCGKLDIVSCKCNMKEHYKKRKFIWYPKKKQK